MWTSAASAGACASSASLRVPQVAPTGSLSLSSRKEAPTATPEVVRAWESEPGSSPNRSFGAEENLVQTPRRVGESISKKTRFTTCHDGAEADSCPACKIERAKAQR